MRLNGALVSSFLFVSAVLAGYHPEKQQPPFLNHVGKSIDSATIFPLAEWAGVTWTADSEEAIETAEGTFFVPHVQNGPDSTFTILMNVGASMCDALAIGVGIEVEVTPDSVAYNGFSRWYISPGVTWYSPYPISAGDEMRASIQVVSPQSAHVTLVNVNEGNSWSSYIFGAPLQPDCRQDVQWIVTPIDQDNNDLPLPAFDPVVINGMLVGVSGTDIVPRRPNIAVSNIGHTRIETSVMVYRDYVIIVYIPPPAAE